jgi:hypothetical protein
MIDLREVSCCLITKDVLYPAPVLDHVLCFPFGEVMIMTGCDSPHRKQELFEKAKYDTIFYQDDDCIAPIQQLAELSKPGVINSAMKAQHLRAYGRSRIQLIGWGSFLPKSAIKVLDMWRAEYGEDFLYKRETERIMTWFNWPNQNRMELPITDLPSAFASDRLSMQPGHYDYIPMVESRCLALEQKLAARST